MPTAKRPERKSTSTFALRCGYLQKDAHIRLKDKYDQFAGS